MVTEKRLIYADPVYEDLRKSYEELQRIREMLTNHEDIQICNGQLATYKEAMLCIKNAPTVEAVEVVHASWIHASNKPGVWIGMKCSLCGARIRYTEFINGNHNYCHKCGARMDGGNEDV